MTRIDNNRRRGGVLALPLLFASLHAYPEVPADPASYGFVRVPLFRAGALQIASYGAPVIVR
jgi:hypothetical protein